MERRFSVEAEIEILKHEVSVLKAMCKDLRMKMEAQDDATKEQAKKNELARKTKTMESQDLELCPKRTDNGGHSWVILRGSSKSKEVYWWYGCTFCNKEKLNSRFTLI